MFFRRHLESAHHGAAGGLRMLSCFNTVYGINEKSCSRLRFMSILEGTKHASEPRKNTKKGKATMGLIGKKAYD